MFRLSNWELGVFLNLPQLVRLIQPNIQYEQLDAYCEQHHCGLCYVRKIFFFFLSVAVRGGIKMCGIFFSPPPPYPSILFLKNFSVFRDAFLKDLEVKVLYFTKM